VFLDPTAPFTGVCATREARDIPSRGV